MAEKKEEKGKREGEHKGKPKRKELHEMRTQKAEDGSFVHFHRYKDEKGQPEMQEHLGGTSADMEDLHQHNEDHWGDGAQDPGEGEQEEEGADEGEGQPAAEAAPEGAAPAEE